MIQIRYLIVLAIANIDHYSLRRCLRRWQERNGRRGDGRRRRGVERVEREICERD
jgi:hypothetical protein